MNKGVSIVVCCHNSSKLLEQTIYHICKLKIPSYINTELLIIDNASSDNTSEFAKQKLTEFKCPFPFRILNQPQLGLSFARKMGTDSSKYEYILFCDDDNWLNEDYIVNVYRIMESDDKIGALGGEAEAVTEGIAPEWFSRQHRNYSVGKQYNRSGNITESVGVLWGAGMVIRKTAMLELYSKGFSSLLSDRKGEQLTSGGDSEKCYALRLAGWKIWYDESLKLKHYISRERLNWKYLRKLNRGFGAQKVDFDPYIMAFQKTNGSNDNSLKWHRQTIKLFKKLRGYGFRKLLNMKSANEGDKEILRIEKTIGRINELLKIRSEYEVRIRSVKEARWRKS